ncbi:c6 transcription factor [Pyrenophora seminiperda CCB06]|uniref:C6 transcription factor n=1 Tax=Pyrenophora seminiperda CCB06 TaxID=1302712 RepID=A0A3M7MB96_9PLEO|nr:c6 transcription factor [Pyrenophora seminiperda CCB06]
MSAVHTCFRSVLAQAFRPSTCGVVTPCSVAAFLVPALARPSKRTFRSGKRRSQYEHEQTPPQSSTEYSQGVVPYTLPPKPKEHIGSVIPFPPTEARTDVNAWLAVIEPFLPNPLRRQPSAVPEIPVTSLDLALVLNNAYATSVDILDHLWRTEGRWQTLVWMMKKLIEQDQESVDLASQLVHYPSLTWKTSEGQTLQQLTRSPIKLERAHPLSKLKLTLDALTSSPDSIQFKHASLKRAMGKVWMTLGNMILAAVERSDDGQETIMPHVLEIIAHLHHLGLIPDAVYTYRAHKDQHVLQQPPTLHMLSSKILTALSDATWKAHEASVKTAKERANAHYFLGHEIPGSRYKVQVTEVSPELWLELVLWSCLHGGWILDGTAILERLATKQGEHSWGLISWREIMEAEQQKMTTLRRTWSLVPMNANASASAEDRARTRRTISSEIITAFVDGLVSLMRVGVGSRGVDPEDLITSIKTLKDLLDANNLSLGSSAWGSVIARLLESGGFVPEKRPELLLRIFELSPAFGTEVGAVNASSTAETEVPYFFEPTTLPLSLLHRAMQAFLAIGDIKSAVTTLKLLQGHADDNKQKSVQRFFELLRSTPQLQYNEPFTSHMAPVEFPAFDIKLPVPLLARLLDSATEAKWYDLGRWLLFSKDLDGPLISSGLYSHRNISASIVRFGTLAGENDLVLNVIKRVGIWNEELQQQRMSANILIALLCCQIGLRRWDAIRGMQSYIAETPFSRFKARPVILSTFVAELLRTSRDSANEKLLAQEAFTELLFSWENIIMTDTRYELYTTLSILSTVDESWKRYSSQFLAFSLRQEVKLSTDDFNRVLGGVLDGYGSTKGKTIVEEWCYKSPKTFEPYRSPGGLPTMPRHHVTKVDSYENRPDDIVLIQDSGAKIVLQGRVHINRQTIWTIIRKVAEEVDLERQGGKSLQEVTRAQVRDTLQWAARMLYYLGLDDEDIIRDLGNLVTLAEIESFTTLPRLAYRAC